MSRPDPEAEFIAQAQAQTAIEKCAAILTDVRNAQGIGQREMGRRITGKDDQKTTMGRWELGQGQPTFKSFIAWCIALDVEPAAVLREAMR